MIYPTKLEKEIVIYNKNKRLGSVFVVQPSAMEYLRLSEVKDNQSQLVLMVKEIISSGLRVEYNKKLVFLFGKLYKNYADNRMRKTINKNFDKISDIIVKLTVKKQDSIFQGITYPSRKGDKRKRKHFFVEVVLMLCKNDASKVNDFLNNYTLEQIYVLLDGVTMINNESVDEYLGVNDLAISKLERKVKKDPQMDSFIDMVQKEHEKRLKEAGKGHLLSSNKSNNNENNN